MASLYLHIPFCRQACHYCDFHFSTQINSKEAMVDAIAREMELQKDYLGTEKIETIYFGGGTPSLLEEREIYFLLEKIHELFQVEANAEITLEANPDDLSIEKLKLLRAPGINRLSIGVQSFFDEHLKWMNRIHNSKQAEESVKAAAGEGFNNISIDLISGIPISSNQQWKKNLEMALRLPAQHLSCYSLTVEPRTALASFIKKGISPGIDEDQAAAQFEVTMEILDQHGWIHYEISNYCKPGFHSRHNSSYWSGESYLGVGPSAHSFNGYSRQWNVSNNSKYLNSLEKGIVPFEKEILTSTQKINERILTSLRTIKGLNACELSDEVSAFIKNKSEKFIREQSAEWKNDSLVLTNKGKLFADRIVLELMFDEKELQSIPIHQS